MENTFHHKPQVFSLMQTAEAEGQQMIPITLIRHSLLEPFGYAFFLSTITDKRSAAAVLPQPFNLTLLPCRVRQFAVLYYGVLVYARMWGHRLMRVFIVDS